MEEFKAILSVSLYTDEQTFLRYFRVFYFRGLSDPVWEIRDTVSKWSPNMRRILSQSELINMMRQIKSICENKDYFYSTQVTAY